MDSDGHASSRRAEQRDLGSRLEILNGLLNTLTDVLDIREVFDHVSQVVQRVLPHDLMGVMEISQGGDRMRLYAGTEKPFLRYEGTVSNPEILTQPWESMITEDFPSHPLAKGTPALNLGIITVLSAPIRFGGRLQAMVNFFSRQAGQFTRDDLPIAERVASDIAVAMFHQRLAEEVRLAAEANARGPWLPCVPIAAQ